MLWLPPRIRRGIVSIRPLRRQAPAKPHASLTSLSRPDRQMEPPGISCSRRRLPRVLALSQWCRIGSRAGCCRHGSWMADVGGGGSAWCGGSNTPENVGSGPGCQFLHAFLSQIGGEMQEPLSTARMRRPLDPGSPVSTAALQDVVCRPHWIRPCLALASGWASRPLALHDESRHTVPAARVVQASSGALSTLAGVGCVCPGGMRRCNRCRDQLRSIVRCGAERYGMSGSLRPCTPIHNPRTASSHHRLF